MKKVYVTWTDVEHQVQDLLRQMQLDSWQPGYVVGITRGGLTPANLISQYLDRPMETLKVSLRDGIKCESNVTMRTDAAAGKNILIVDDINDTGATLNWIREDWRCDMAWGNNVRTAVLYDNEASGSIHPPNYAARSINKACEPQWIVFPWEQWWHRSNSGEQYQ